MKVLKQFTFLNYFTAAIYIYWTYLININKYFVFNTKDYCKCMHFCRNVNNKIIGLR